MKSAGVSLRFTHHHVPHARVDNGKRKERLCYL